MTEEELRTPEVHYPLRVVSCAECDLVQLEDTVDPSVLFTDRFVYRTGHNATLRNHFEELVDKLVEAFDLGTGDFVLDIGSNDGTLLSYYPDDVTLLGVDPSKAAEVAIENDVPTRRDFFDDTLAAAISDEHGAASVITCTNTFAHVADLDSLMAGVDQLLAPDGVFVQESHYLRDLVTELQFGEIYHEHLRYYTVQSLVNLFDRYGMEVVAAERVPPHGGCIKTVAARKGEYDLDASVERLLAEERELGLNDRSHLTAFAETVADRRLSLLDRLTDLRRAGHRIAGVGAAAKGVSRLNYCRVGPELVEYIAETNEDKIGKYTPGTHVPIVDEAQLLEDDPEYALLLAWNLADVIIPKLRDAGFEGEIIRPDEEL